MLWKGLIQKSFSAGTQVQGQQIVYPLVPGSYATSPWKNTHILASNIALGSQAQRVPSVENTLRPDPDE